MFPKRSLHLKFSDKKFIYILINICTYYMPIHLSLTYLITLDY